MEKIIGLNINEIALISGGKKRPTKPIDNSADQTLTKNALDLGITVASGIFYIWLSGIPTGGFPALFFVLGALRTAKKVYTISPLIYEKLF